MSDKKFFPPTSPKKKFLYETHLHTAPVSRCASAGVRESLLFYKALGYDGVFITNHFIDGNCSADRSLSYEERIEYYFSAVEDGKRMADEIGIKVFEGVESSHQGSDFLIYGLYKEWYLAHPEIMEMKKSEALTLMANEGALIIQAHPFREHRSTDRISLFPRYVHGAEIYNANQRDFNNEMALHYAESYELIPTAGSDNHSAKIRHLGGMEADEPIESEADYVRMVKSGALTPFKLVLTDEDLSAIAPQGT